MGQDEWDSMPGSSAVAGLAPTSAELFTRLCAVRPIGTGRLALVRRTCARVLGLAPLDDLDREGGATLGDDVVEAFATQFSIDVAALDDELRREFTETCGTDTFGTVQAIYLADMAPRVRAALDALFGESDGWPTRSPSEDDPNSWALIEEFIRVVHNMDSVDPVTSEVVRLRGARAHNCRLCQSLRSAPALAAGADEDLWAAIDGPQPDLTLRHRAAVALTDAMIWTPSRFGPDVVARVRAEFSPTQAVELVLDVMRNAANKIAVSLGADEARVSEGTEVYEIDADGVTHYGVA